LIAPDAITRLRAFLGLSELSRELAEGVKAVLRLGVSAATVDDLASRIRLDSLAHATVNTAVLIGGLLAVFFVLERLTTTRPTVYASRIFVQDVLYAFFYQGGLYTILIWSAIANALESRLAFARVEVLVGLPGPLHWILYVVVVDFITYWWHRMLHTWTPMWAFHSVHHAQEDMSFISSYRMHPVEQFGQSLIMVVPLLIIGVPTWRWLPLYVTMLMFEAAQHSALDLTFGRAYALVVSPRFHALHHARDASVYNGNYAKVFSVWDFLFGTAIRAERPDRFGVEGLPAPRTIWAQLLAPIRILRDGT
jgi:sterol desaturase/sphingolipid hydroxylase (fatty acid hydroxylase superfamily)